jgi:lipopolysaccharide cholinephosphotransferase
VRVPVSLIYKALGYRYYLKKYDQLASSLKNDDTNHAGIIIYGEGLKKEYCEKGMFTNASKVSFEGVEFNAPADVDKYLTQMYGNYMQLPPEEDRKVHPSKTFWK